MPHLGKSTKKICKGKPTISLYDLYTQPNVHNPHAYTFMSLCSSSYSFWDQTAWVDPQLHQMWPVALTSFCFFLYEGVMTQATSYESCEDEMHPFM